MAYHTRGLADGHVSWHTRQSCDCVPDKAQHSKDGYVTSLQRYQYRAWTAAHSVQCCSTTFLQHDVVGAHVAFVCASPGFWDLHRACPCGGPPAMAHRLRKRARQRAVTMRNPVAWGLCLGGKQRSRYLDAPTVSVHLILCLLSSHLPGGCGHSY